MGSTYLKEKKNYTNPHVPYLPPHTFRGQKKYSFFFFFDETLIHFKVNNNYNDEGVLKLRPGAGTFLEVLKEYYESILFTEASEAYTELIMEAFIKMNFLNTNYIDNIVLSMEKILLKIYKELEDL